VKRSVLIVSEENLVYNIERVPDVKALAFGQLLTSDFQLFSIILGACVDLTDLRARDFMLLAPFPDPLPAFA